jgi:hypothetical protein
MVTSRITIEPNGIYDDALLCNALEVGAETLARARRSGELRYRRVGRRPVYLGLWILAWLRSEEQAPQAQGVVRA